ncbi:centrosomal protein of 152 kDa-like [Coregonus clupeaformis]|uniref:centrosomal protein of 152 kDa-like n=1 Tax=Coregonus clupeaformis TaxID=59861 RepID=UPI001E1C6EED|nr:centrosomal protein of 152 kDa-like [Coregonus clupeaformis]
MTCWRTAETSPLRSWTALPAATQTHATGSVQEMGQLQIKLQRTQSAKTMNDDMNKALQALEKRNAELKQSEGKVKGANSELCTKMREIIQELDQEKQEAAQRYERTQQQMT